MNNNKKCRACFIDKPIQEYPFFSTSEAGRKNTCKECSKKLAVIRKDLKSKNPPPPPDFCPICNLYTENWILDHCHYNHTFRGYICNSCNLGLGRFNDDIECIYRAYLYMKSRCPENNVSDIFPQREY